MKTKITFLLASLLMTLFSVNANAQSNTTPIKGDVNGDGVVDVADINAIIAIMKDGGGTVTEHKNNCYIGVTKKEVFTEDDLNQYVAERPSKITIPAGQYGTWIYPASWGKPTSAISNLSNAEEVQAFNYSDLTLPNGYTGMWINLTSETTYTLTWPEYTWYKGMASEQEIQTQSYIDGLSLNQTTKPTDTITMNKGYNVMLFPSSWGIPTLWEDTNHTFEAGIYTAEDLGINNPTGYNVIVYEFNDNITLYVQWK